MLMTDREWRMPTGPRDLIDLSSTDVPDRGLGKEEISAAVLWGHLPSCPSPRANTGVTVFTHAWALITLYPLPGLYRRPDFYCFGKSPF